MNDDRMTAMAMNDAFRSMSHQLTGSADSPSSVAERRQKVAQGASPGYASATPRRHPRVGVHPTDSKPPKGATELNCSQLTITPTSTHTGKASRPYPCHRILSLSLLLCLIAFVSSPVGGDDARPVESRFTYVDLMINPHGKSLAAWQIEFAAEVGQVSLVGVEAGAHPAYAKRPAYYDPAALKGRRIIVGDFSLEKDLPAERTRVCRLMLEIRGAARPQYVAKLMAAADAEGNKIDAAVEVVEGR